MSHRTKNRFVARSLVVLILATSTFSGTLGLPAFAVDPNVVIGYNNEGVKALNSGNFALAIQKFQEALKLDPSYQLARDNLAIAHNNYGLQLAKGNPQAALKQFHEAFYLNRTNATTQQNVDGIIRMLGKDPRNFADRMALGDASRLSADFIGAIIEYSEATKLKADPKAFTKLGDVYRVRDDLSNAIKAYQQGVASGDSAELEVKLGQALQAKGDLPAAVQCFGKALALKPDDNDTLDALQAAWEDALKKDPLAPDNHIGLGQALQFRGDYGGAKGEYQQAIQLSKGNNPTAAKLLAALPELQKRANFDKHINNGVDLQAKKLFAPALEEYKIAAGLDPSNPKPWLNMGTVYQAQEDFDKAIEAYTKALQLDPKNADASTGLTSCQDLRKAKQIAASEDSAKQAYAGGKYDEAIQKYLDLIKTEPKNAAYHYNLAACLQMQKKFDNAISEYKIAISLDGKTKAYQDALAGCLKQMAEPIIADAVKKHEAKDYTGAIDGYQKALAIQPDNVSLWYNLASAQYSREDFARARDAYQKAYDLDPKGQIDDLYLIAVIDENFDRAAQAQTGYQKYLATAPNGRYLKEAKEHLTNLNKTGKCAHIKLQSEIAKEKDAEDAYQAAFNLDAQGKVDDAIPLAQKAIAAMPNVDTYVAFLGLLYQKKNKFDDAIAQYKQAAALNPKNDEWPKAIDNVLALKAAPLGEAAVAKQKEGDLAGAISLYQQAIAVLPKNAGLWRNMGSAYQAQDNFQQAYQAYANAFNIDPKTEAENLYYMGQISETLNQGSKALDEFKRYVAAMPGGQYASQAKARIQVLAVNPNNVLKLQTQQEIKTAQELDKLYNEAKAAYEAKRYDEAIPLYQKVMSIKPNDSTLVFAMGVLYQEKGDLASALTWYQKAAGMDAKNKQYSDAVTATLAGLAGPAMEEGYKKQLANDYAGAIELYKRGLQQYPDNAAGWTSLAACYQQLDDFANARTAYETGYNKDKKSQADNLYFMAVIDENFNQGLKAKQEYQSYVIASPRGSYAPNAQQRIAALTANPGAVQKIPTKQDQQNAADLQAAYDAGLKAQQAGNFDEAITQYQKAISMSPRTFAYVYALATAYDNKGDLDNAILKYKEAIAIDPKNPDPKNYLKSAQQRKAAPLVDLAIKKQTDATKPDLPGAILDYEAAIRVYDGDAGTWMNYGTALQGAEQNQKALNAYRKALTLDPNPTVTGECYYYLGTLYEAMRQPLQAVPEYQKYIKFLPAGPNVAVCKERIKLLAAVKK